MENGIEKIRRAKRDGRKIAALTAYDYPVARLLDESGIDLILVGDSLGMVVLGYPDTTSVTMADMVHHCRAVARGVQHALLVADLPFGSYDTPGTAVANARRLADAGAQAVKLEGGVSHEAVITEIVAAGISVCGHIGMLPQSIREEGAYRIKGGTSEGASALLEDARAVERAGAFAVVLELVDARVAKEITALLAIPTIGIGSGPDCDGQILVTHDLIGLFPWFKPKFVSRKAHVADEIRAGVAAFIAETRKRV